MTIKCTNFSNITVHFSKNEKRLALEAYVPVHDICYSSIPNLNRRRQILARCRDFIYSKYNRVHMYKLRIFTPLFDLFPFHRNVFLCVKSVYDNIVQNLSSSIWIWFRNRTFTETMFKQRRGIFVNLPKGDDK